MSVVHVVPGRADLPMMIHPFVDDAAFLPKADPVDYPAYEHGIRGTHRQIKKMTTFYNYCSLLCGYGYRYQGPKR